MHYERITQIQTRIIIGIKQTVKALKNNQVSEVFVADDAKQELTSEVIDLANARGIPCYHVDSMKKLGQSCGIEVGATTVAVRK